MKFKVSAVLYYDDEGDKEEALSKLEEAFEKATVINPGTEAVEASFYQSERCYHDEDPPQPCVLVRNWIKAP